MAKKTKEEVNTSEAIEAVEAEVKSLPRRIRMVRTYQSAKFEKVTAITQFCEGAPIGGKKIAFQLTLNEVLRGVDVCTDKDHIFIPMDNIAYIQYHTAESLQEKEDAKLIHRAGEPKGIKSQEIRRPR